MANNKVDLGKIEAKKSFTVDSLRSHWANYSCLATGIDIFQGETLNK